MEKRRLEYVDVARGIAMLCVIIGHLGIHDIDRVVFTFHIPLFYLISGYFISEKSSLSDFVRHKAKTLLVPYYITGAVMILLGMIKGLVTEGINGMIGYFAMFTTATIYGAGDTYKEPFTIIMIGATWFLWATFWGSLFLKLSLKMRANTRIAFISALFLIGYYSRTLMWFPVSIQAGCCATLFMYIGYLYKKSVSLRESCPVEIKYVWLLFATVVWAFFIKDFRSFWLVHCDIGRGVIDIFGTLCACYVVIQISKLISRINWLKKGLSFIGRNSLIVLCVHNVELQLLRWWRIAPYLCKQGMTMTHVTILIILGKFVMDLSITWLISTMRRKTAE